MSEGRPRVRWFSLVFGAALIFLGGKIYFYENPQFTAELERAVALAGRLFFALGGLSVAVVIVGAVWRSPKARLFDLLEALAYGGVGVFLLWMRSQGKGGGLFESPLLPATLLLIGLIKVFIASRELKKTAPPPSRR